MNRRRSLLQALAASLLPGTALAQLPRKIPIVAFVASVPTASELAGPEPRNDFVRAFVHRLRELGWEEGRNITIERHSAEDSLPRARAIFAELSARKVDVIATAGNLGATHMSHEASRATRTVPVVFVGGGADPVGSGLVTSLARPGGNVTGFTVVLGPEFALKRLELLKAIVPRTKRVAVLAPKADFDSNIEQVREGAERLGLSLFLVAAEKAEDFEHAFAAAVRGKADAMYVSAITLNRAHRSRIVELAARHRLPTEYFFRVAAEEGGLAAYGVDLMDLSRRSAGYVDRILRGARPGDLPVERPSKFELLINLKTARALGLKIPQSILMRADRVIE
jgi:putative ABC transport system substrate-binding protein